MSAVLNGIGIYLLIGLAALACLVIYNRVWGDNTPEPDCAQGWCTAIKEKAFAFLILLLIWPLAVGIILYEQIFNRRPPAPVYRTWTATPESLIERLTVETIEQREIYSDPLNAVPPIPFGHLNAAWQRFCQTQQTGDQLWSFRIDTREDDGLKLFDRHGVVEGYALLREGMIRGEFFVRME